MDTEDQNEGEYSDAFSEFKVAGKEVSRVDPQKSFERRVVAAIDAVQAGATAGPMFKQTAANRWEVTPRNGVKPMKVRPQGATFEAGSAEEVVKILTICKEQNALGKFAAIYAQHQSEKAKFASS